MGKRCGLLERITRWTSKNFAACPRSWLSFVARPKEAARNSVRNWYGDWVRSNIDVRSLAVEIAAAVELDERDSVAEIREGLVDAYIDEKHRQRKRQLHDEQQQGSASATTRSPSAAQGADGMSERQDGKPIRVIFVKLPRCPQCGSERLHAYGKVRRGPPGSKTGVRYTRCEQCSQRVHLNIS